MARSDTGRIGHNYLTLGSKMNYINQTIQMYEK